MTALPFSTEDFRIETVPTRQRDEALQLLFKDLLPAQQREQINVILSAMADDGQMAQALLGAYRRAQLVGAVLAQPQPGKTALVWLPETTDGEPPTTTVGLLDMESRWLGGRGVRIAQAMPERVSDAQQQALEQTDYRHVADLLYLVCQADQFPTQPPGDALQFEPYQPEDPARLIRVVEATYEQSRDCPALDGVREMGDVLEGYRATGVFDPNRWLIVRHGRQDVGCLLLADHPEHGNWELVYMGVVSSQRGKAWGIEITRYAQWLTGRAGRQRLVLAVDAANGPAIRMYSAAGFRSWDQRHIYLKVF